MSAALASALERRSIELTSLPVQSNSHSVEDCPSAPQLSAPPLDDVPDGGYGWVVVLACSLITYVHLRHLSYQYPLDRI
jgi:hypothetical protein